MTIITNYNLHIKLCCDKFKNYIEMVRNTMRYIKTFGSCYLGFTFWALEEFW